MIAARRADDAPATSDTAVIESYVLMASQGQLLVGAYSRFQWHHPGPFYFYVLAPFYAASGHKTAGLDAGAGAISIASVLITATVLMRRRPLLAATVSAALALFAWRAAEATTSPWNPHVPLLPLVALIVVAADVVAGRARLLPGVALLASLAAQAHIALVPCAFTLGAIPFARAVWGAVHGSAQSHWRRSLGVTILALGAAWSLPIYEQLSAMPRGNLTELWRFFLHQPRHGQAMGVAISAWSDMLAGIVRPDFYVAHGWPFVESPVRWAEALTLVTLGMVVGSLVRSRRSRDSFGVSLATLLVVSSAVSLWSATRIEERVFDHDVFWMAGIGLLNLAVAFELAGRLAVGPGGRRDGLLRVTSGALVALTCALAMLTVNRAVRRSFSPAPDALIARALARDLEQFLTAERVGRPLITIDQDAWGYVAGAVLDLQKRGRIVSVEDDWVVMFTPLFRATGHEDAVVSVAMPPEHLRLQQQGRPTISAHEPVFAHLVPVSAR